MLKIDLENLIIARYVPQINLFCVYRSRWGGIWMHWCKLMNEVLCILWATLAQWN